ncbi:MAG TPA: NADH-quinone oxidoreductase subunit NuoK [Micromonosporaceae bacterium]|nr:NADH-quinone oxidoreductase subunit NuoK [Micromonosporaceae bacterium]
MHPVIPYVTAALLFGTGVYGVLRRRNAVLLLMSVELMLNAVNLILVTADATVRAALPATGQVFALFVIVLAAAEVGVGLAIVLQLYRLHATIALDTVALSPPDDTAPLPPPGSPPDGPPDRGGPPPDRGGPPDGTGPRPGAGAEPSQPAPVGAA